MPGHRARPYLTPRCTRKHEPQIEIDHIRVGFTWLVRSHIQGLRNTAEVGEPRVAHLDQVEPGFMGFSVSGMQSGSRHLLHVDCNLEDLAADLVGMITTVASLDLH